MITGVVNADLEATIPLVVRGTNAKRKRDSAQPQERREERQIYAVIDTGFTGYLTLPSALVTHFDLEWLSLEHALLGAGSIHSFDVYRAIVIWDGESREVEVNLTETGPLIGMSMLFSQAMRIEVVIGGLVRIARLE